MYLHVCENISVCVYISTGVAYMYVCMYVCRHRVYVCMYVGIGYMYVCMYVCM